MIDMNLKGVLYGIAAATPHMIRQKQRSYHQCRFGGRVQGAAELGFLGRDRRSDALQGCRAHAATALRRSHDVR
jgi:hypothetical protein